MRFILSIFDLEHARSRFLRATRAVWLSLFFFLLIGCEPKPETRIAVLPRPGSIDPAVFVLSDALHRSLSTGADNDFHVLPVENVYRMAVEDSLVDSEAMLDLGRRLGLPFVVVVASDAVRDSRVEFLDMGGNQSESLTVSRAFGRNDLDSLEKRLAEILDREDVGLSGKHLVSVADRDAYGRARRAELLEQLDDAESAYRGLVASDSSRIDCLNGLARVLIAQGFAKQDAGDFAEDVYEEAIQLLKRSMLLNPEDAEAYRLMGKIGVHLERWNRAEVYLQEAIRLNPRCAETHFLMTRLHKSRIRGSGSWSRRRLLERAIALDPANEAAWLSLGELFYYRNRSNKAEDAYRRLLTIRPSSLDGLLALGKLYTYRNDVLNIVRVYERVLELDPENADAYYNLGIAYYNDGKIEQAVRFFDRATVLGYVDGHFYLGVIHAERGDRERAIACFRERIRLRQKPDEPFAEEARKSLRELLREGEPRP